MKITPLLEREVLAKAAEGFSARRISEWLAAEKRIKISPQAINQRLRQTKDERAVVAKAVTRDTLTPHVVGDLDILAKERDRVERLSGRLHARTHAALDTLDRTAAGETTKENREAVRIAILTTESMADLALKASDRVERITNRKLHYAGAGDGNAETLDVASMSDEELATFTGADRAKSRRGGA